MTVPFELRVPSPADAEAWFALFDDPEIMRYIGDGRLQSRQWYQEFAARQRALAAESGLCLFAVVRPGVGSAVAALGVEARPPVSTLPAAPTGIVAGFVGLQPWTQPWGPTGRTEIGWRLGREHQGLGLATAAARLCLAKAAATGIHDPIAMIDVQNAASIAVAQKLGMRSLDEVDAPSGRRVEVYGFDEETPRARRNY